MNPDYKLATYKIVLSFIFAGIIGLIIENQFSEATKQRDRDRALFENAVLNLERFGSTLAIHRSVLNRVLLSPSNWEVHREFYDGSYNSYTAAKLPFIMSMSRNQIGDQNTADAFGALNEQVIAIDGCLSNRQNANECVQRINLFMKQSTDFENVILGKLNIR